MKKILLPVKRCWVTVLCIGVCLFQNAFAQLKINDTIPDLLFREVLNADQKIVSLSNFRNKALIIEFWDTHCKSCLENLSKLDSVQQQFQKDLQILLVTKQSKKEIQDFFSRFKKIKVPAIPLIVGDTILNSLFPSEGYPYVVWIDKGGAVKHLTGNYNVTPEHVDQFLKGNNIKMKYAGVKTVYAPLWTLDDSSFQKNVKYYSSLTSCINGLDIHEPDGALLKNGRSVQISCNCVTILELFKIAFGEGGKYPINTRYGIKAEMDSVLFIKPSDPNKWDEWERNHLFSYQLVLPASKKEFLYETMQEDLIRYFDVTAVRQKEKIKGYFLSKVSNKPLQVSRADQPFDSYNDGNINLMDTLFFLKQPLQRLSFLINSWIYYSFPFQSKINDNVLIDFAIKKSFVSPLNMKELRAELRKYNLELSEGLIETEVLVIRPKSKRPLNGTAF
jgi:thiol-disulfide isomerase/thioredoxin